MKEILGLYTELFRSRELLFALVSRGITQRYRGSALGFLWSILNPLLLMAVYALVFKYYLRFQSVEHYHIFLFCGLLPWLWCTSSISESTSSISQSGHLITKSLFPPQILAVVPVFTNFLNLVLALPILFIFMMIAGKTISFSVLLLPVALLLQAITLAGIALLVSSLNVIFRDLQHLVQHLLAFLFFLSPIVYPESAVPENFKWTIDLNPFAAFIRIYHSLLFQAEKGDLSLWIMMVVFAAVSTLLGGWVFSRLRERFPECL